MTSGAPPSSTLRCALSAQITPCHGRSIARRPTTLAPVPLKTGKTVASVAEVLLHGGLQPRGRLVGAVGRGVAVVDGGDGVQRLGQDGGVVVAREGSHGARR